jgi:hypothetical protein
MQSIHEAFTPSQNLSSGSGQGNRNLSHPGNLGPITPHPTPYNTKVFLENIKGIPPTVPAQGNESPFFTQAQAHNSLLLVLFAWEGSATKSTSARQARYGVAKRHFVEETNKGDSSTWVEPPSVPTGNVPSAVPTLEPATVTNVWAVERGIMEPRTALEHRRNRALMPYHHNAWHHMLTMHNLLKKYLSIPHSLQFGFDTGICPIISMFTPDNSSTLYVHTKQYQDIMD